MSDILIRGMEMPDIGYREIRIYPNGHVIEKDECGRDEIVGTAKRIPPHGRLIDADALQSMCDGDCYGCPYDSCMINNYIADAPTVIEAEEGQTNE